MLLITKGLKKACETHISTELKQSIANLKFPFNVVRTKDNNQCLGRLPIDIKRAKNLRWSIQVDRARRKVKHFANMLLDYKIAGFITDEEFKQYTNKSGLNTFLFNIVEPLECLLNTGYNVNLFRDYMDAIHECDSKKQKEIPKVENKIYNRVDKYVVGVVFISVV